VKFAHVQALDRAGFLAQVESWSWIANLQAERRRAVLEDVAAVLRDQATIAIPYRTDLHVARRRRA
jgi:hypothetical protein